MPRFRLAFVLNRRIEEQERKCVCACGSPQANHPLVHLRLLEGPVQPCGPHTLSLHIALLKRAMLQPMPHSLCAGGEWFVHVQWWMGVSVPWRRSVLCPPLPHSFLASEYLCTDVVVHHSVRVHDWASVCEETWDSCTRLSPHAAYRSPCHGCSGSEVRVLLLLSEVWPRARVWWLDTLFGP